MAGEAQNTGLAGRYAAALFDLAIGGRQLDEVTQSLARLEAALVDSADLRQLTQSPLVGRAAAGRAAESVGRTLDLDQLTRNFVGVLAANGRLAQLTPVIRAFRRMAAAHRGETTAEVTSAHPLDAGQQAALKAKLRDRLKRDVALDTRVDPAILGGLIVKIGSRQIDNSIRTKLAGLTRAMKG